MEDGPSGPGSSGPPESPARVEASEVPRRSARRGGPPKLLTLAALVVLGVVVAGVLVARDGVPSIALPGTGGSGGGPNTGSDLDTVVPSGSSWALATGHFVAVWFGVETQAEIQGSFQASARVYALILPAAEFLHYVPSNASYGSVPAGFDPASAPSNWSSGASGGTYVDTILDGGAYELLFVNTGTVSAVNVVATSDFTTSTEAVS